MNFERLSHLLRILLCGMVIAVAFAGCSSEPLGSSAYKYTQALHSICNRRDEGRLADFEDRLAEARRKNDITDDEVERLRKIIQTAESGNWEEATADARELMEQQVQR